MKNLFSTTIISLLLIVATSLSAKTLSQQDALSVANDFFNQQLSPTQQKRSRNQKLSLKHTQFNSTGETPLYYIFNQEENGFVIVAGDDNITPIIGYSDNNSFDTTNIPANFKFFLNQCNKNIEYAISKNINLKKAKHRTSNSPDFAPSIAPLLGDIAFTQSKPYYNLCPKQNGEHSAVGCVAISMGQIMTYYKHPAKGDSSFSYTSDTHKFKLYADFSATTYDWENILHSYKKGSYTKEQADAVAEMLYHCGIAVEMDYSVGGSASNEVYAAKALVTYFGYDEGIKVANRQQYTYEEWTNIIKKELNEKRPIIYSGSSSIDGGHAFNCDGYDENNLFHINWGWGGYCNGYFNLNLLDADITNPSNLHYGYDLYQSIVIGIQPDNEDEIKDIQHQLELYDGIYYDEDENEISFSCYNYGIVPFDGKIGLAFYDKNNNFIETTFESKQIVLSPLRYLEYTVTPATLPENSDKVISVYQNTNSTEWHTIPYGKNMPNYLNIVNGTELQNPEQFDESPIEVISLKPIGNVYQNRTARFSAKIKNVSDSEYYGAIAVYATNYDNEYEEVESEYIPVALKSGEVAEYEIHIENMNVSLGDYYCYIVYDNYDGYLTYIYGDYYYSNEVDFPVVSVPKEKTYVYLTNKLSFDKTSKKVFKSEETPIIKARIGNRSGYAQGYVAAVIFDNQYDVVYSFATKKIILDTYENSEMSFLCDFSDLTDGDYYLNLQFYDPFLYSPKWESIQPTEDKNLLPFTIKNDEIIPVENTQQTDITVFPTNTRNIINIISDNDIINLSLLNIAGKKLISAQPHTSTTHLNIQHLNSGIYLLQIKTTDKTETIKIIKQ